MKRLQLRCPSCNKAFELNRDDWRLGRAQCPHCSVVAALPDRADAKEKSSDGTGGLPPVYAPALAEQAVAAAADTAGFLPPMAAVAATRPGSMRPVLPPVAEVPLGDLGVTSRAQTLASDQQSQKRFRKNVVVWIVCTLILTVAVIVLVNVTG